MYENILHTSFPKIGDFRNMGLTWKTQKVQMAESWPNPPDLYQSGKQTKLMVPWNN